MEPAIFFAGPPNLKELCCLSVLVSTSDNLCVMQPHIVRCREIIFTEPDVLASPTLDMDATFHIVLQQSLYKTGRLQMRLQKYGMQISKPYSVHHNLYQSCLTYTTIARISPQWNKAADWMIQGRDFVNHDGYTNAIKMSICVNREEIYISLSGTVVRFPPLQVEDLNLSRSEMLALLKSTEGVPRPVELDDAWCHVLPSMKRGKIASLALSIPKESPFASYKELKRHWKNMYGYRLPDTDEDILYCQIGFLPSGGGKHFTYPSVCLRGGPLHAVPRVDPKPVLTAFLQDIHSRVATVCGMALRFQPKLRYATPALHTSSMPPVRENLSTKQISKPNGPTRDEKSVASLFARKNTKKDPLIERLQDVAQPQPCNGSDGTDPVLSNPPLADVASIQEGYGFQQHQPYQKTTMENSLHSTHASLADTSCHSEESKHVWNEEITQTSNMLSSSFTTYRKEQKTSGVALEKSRQRPALANWCGESMAEDDFDCLLGTPTTGGNKRKKANQADTPVKKLTPKPQVQNVDVEALSRANQLSKVNTVTITAWLKEKKVACKSKDRKSDLVNKVNAFLNLPKTQF